uniref:Uncharacterized protein n=1 Tax=Daphnia galeata TaxID=27404 RepID=A0A8J2RW27_9CRUS|nr:unnamed protein product [Daphnia galeata]
MAYQQPASRKLLQVAYLPDLLVRRDLLKECFVTRFAWVDAHIALTAKGAKDGLNFPRFTHVFEDTRNHPGFAMPGIEQINKTIMLKWCYGLVLITTAVVERTTNSPRLLASVFYTVKVLSLCINYLCICILYNAHVHDCAN